MLIYCDSVILIYFFDHVGALQVRAASRLGALHTAADRLAVSDLVRMECRVMPVRLGDSTKLALFDSFFSQPDVASVPLTTAVFNRATDIRAHTASRLSTPSILPLRWNTDAIDFSPTIYG